MKFIFLFLVLNFVWFLSKSFSKGTPSRSGDDGWRISTDEMTEDNTEEDIFDGIYHDTSSYYMAVNDF